MLKAKYHTIRIDEQILNNAKREHSKRCMVADAIRSQIPGAESIDVTADSIRFNLDGTRFCYQTPGRAAAAIASFDDEGPEVIEPFSFQLDARSATEAPVSLRGRHKKPIKKRDPAYQPKSHCRRQKSRRRHGLKVVE